MIWQHIWSKHKRKWIQYYVIENGINITKKNYLYTFYAELLLSLENIGPRVYVFSTTLCVNEWHHYILHRMILSHFHFGSSFGWKWWCAVHNGFIFFFFFLNEHSIIVNHFLTRSHQWTKKKNKISSLPTQKSSQWQITGTFLKRQFSVANIVWEKNIELHENLKSLELKCPSIGR